MIAEGSHPSGRRSWVMLTGKPPKAAKIKDEGTGNLEWKVEEGDDECHL